MISRHQDCVDVVWSYLIDRDRTAQHLSSESDLNAAELWFTEECDITSFYQSTSHFKPSRRIQRTDRKDMEASNGGKNIIFQSNLNEQHVKKRSKQSGDRISQE